MAPDDAAPGLIALPPAASQGEDVSDALWRQMAEHAPAIMLVAAAPDFRIVYANRAAYRAAACTVGALTGQLAADAFSFIDPELLGTRAPAHAHAVAGGGADRCADRCADGGAVQGAGKPGCWDLSYAPLENAAGPLLLITAVNVTHHDITKTQAQAALRDSEARFRNVLLQIPAAMFIIEAPDERVTFKNLLLDKVLGNTDLQLDEAKATLSGWAVHKDGTPYELSEYPSRRALSGGETVRAEPMVFRRRDGTLVDLEVHAGPVRNEAGEIVAAVDVVLDVTDRRVAEARQDFLFRLQDSLRALTDPREILNQAATLLGRHLGAARIGYSEMQPDGETVLIMNGYVHGLRPVTGLYKLAQFGAYHAQQMRQGKTISYEDVQADQRGGRAFGIQLGTRAHVSVPLLRDGRYTGSLYVTHDKPHVWAADEISLIEDVAARIWDAAERGRAEARLRDSEERLRLVMESTRLGTWEYDPFTGKATGSARHDEIFGHTAPVPDWGFEWFITHVPEPHRAQVEAGFRAALEQGKDWDVECPIIKADGSHGWLKIGARPHHGPDGKIVRLLGTVADITERKQTEESAIANAAKFEMFAQTLPSMVWTSLPDGSIDWFNARVPEYSGRNAADMKPNGWAPVHPDDMQSAIDTWQQSLRTGKPFDAEYRIRRHDGEFRWHITRAVPIRGADGAITLWIGSSADIQDQKNSEQALAALNATLEQLVRERTAELMAAEATLRQSQKMEAVGQLTGGLAHDFNNLLTGISGSLELLSIRISEGKLTDLDRYLNVAQGAAKRAAALTHRLLAFSRRQTLDSRPADINQLVHGMGELIRGTVTPAVTVRLAAAPEAWVVLVDTNQLENALLNLCINARDAMPDGGQLTIATQNRTLDEAEAKALELQPGAYVSLSVTDTGGGMSADVIARAFDPFFTTKPIGEGTGLGLSMVYGFVRQSGGQARIQSAPGQGTTVSLYLPRSDSTDRNTEALASGQEGGRGQGETVLVVDDEPAVRMLVAEVLLDLGYNVLQAENGAAGLHRLNACGRVDLLVTDVGLPGGMNGRQLADAALVTRPDLKILFITGYAENAVIGQGNLKPGMHIMTKPFSLDALGGRIRDIIAAG